MLLTSALLAVVCCALAAAVVILLQRRHDHQRTLDELPTGLCALGADNRILLWNRQMQQLSGLPARELMGKPLDTLPAPWPDALRDSIADPGGRVIKRSLVGDADVEMRWFILHGSAQRSPGERRLVMVDEITDYQRLQDELLHKERLASIGRVAAGVAHEIGNPVTGIACVAQNLVESPDAAELEQGAAEILKQTERISRIVSSLMQLSHPGSGARDAQSMPCNLADCVDEAIHLLTLDREVPAGYFDNRCDREVLVSGDNQLLLQVFLNLLDNARTAAGGEAPVRVSTQVRDDQVFIYVDNAGQGIARELRERVFEPFYTTKEVGKGTGLGLPLVRRALETMGGSISLRSPAPGRESGTRATLRMRGASYPPEFLAQDPAQNKANLSH